ncbi:MAG: DNA adenine methylase [Phycisphaerales bacterium]
MIKYIGSKRVLVPSIVGAIRAAWEAVGGDWDRAPPRVLDLFSGTSRVGHALKKSGCAVVANDHNAYAHTLAKCYVQTDATPRLCSRAGGLISRLNRLADGHPAPTGEGHGLAGGYFHDTFCVKSRFVHPCNGVRIDACREMIAEWKETGELDEELEAVLLASLMEAADRVDSTTGLQMAYLKRWAPRAFKPLRLRPPDLVPPARGGRCTALGLDAFDALETEAAEACDVVYIDPPYNQHSYLGNYHVWESLVRWDKPAVYGVACKRADVRERRSIFNSRPRFAGAMSRLLGAVRAPVVVLSFNDEGFLTRDEIGPMLSALHGGEVEVTTIENDYPRYVGAKIGVHDHLGRRVGLVRHLRNKEYLYVARRTSAPARARPARRAMPPAVALSA